MWKKVLLLIIILVLAAVGGVTVYLNNIDWNRHKDKISQQFSAATGKEVVFDGPVRFSLAECFAGEGSESGVVCKRGGCRTRTSWNR